jgi:tetratricopeptide (TPR) repeat protein
MRAHVLLLAVAALACANPPRPAHDDATAARAQEVGGPLGTVEFPVSCADEARPSMERGLALLHHMTYEAAADAFDRAAGIDPECAMAYWGRAMTYIHPLWSDPPGADGFEHGKRLIAEARARGHRTPREEAFIDAAAAYYDAGRGAVERPNLLAFERGWARAHRRFAEDVEAAAFYALAHLATADPGDKSFAHQRAAGALMERVLASHPDHPAAHHYLIHAYDAPTLAAGGLATARHYGAVAPEVAHALHMPTHTFTRLGRWDESIAWNLRSAEAARAHPVGGRISLHYLHALDYLAYAYLQTGRDSLAEAVAETLAGLRGPFVAEIAVPYTLAAVPARLALERRRWDEAASLTPRAPADFPWERFPATEALTHFARALGAAHLGDLELARRSIADLERLREEAGRTSDYWAEQIHIQILASQAWLQWAQRDTAGALATMRRAADRESATEKHAVTPGELLPARELLGDLLLEAERPAEARDEYERALQRSPGRLNSMRGAARAARLAADATERPARARGR